MTLHRIYWNHPVLGTIIETICLDHERDVLRALKTLGIGSGGITDNDPNRQCQRCYQTKPPRVWLREKHES